jgi:hypothetical protein
MFFRPFFIIMVSCLLLTACVGGVSTVKLAPEVIEEKSVEKLLPSRSKQTLDVMSYFQDKSATSTSEFVKSNEVCDLNETLKKISTPLHISPNSNKTIGLYEGGLA